MKTYIHPLTVAIMAASNFIQGYTPDDLKNEIFSSCFDASFDERNAEVVYIITFDSKGRATKLDVDVWFNDGNNALWLEDYRSSMAKGVSMINEFTSSYTVKTIFPREKASVFDEYIHDIYYDNKYREGVH